MSPWGKVRLEKDSRASARASTWSESPLEPPMTNTLRRPSPEKPVSSRDSFTESGEVVLHLENDDFQWTVYFLDDAGNAVDVLDFDAGMVRR